MLTKRPFANETTKKRRAQCVSETAILLILDQNGQLDLKKKGQLDRYTPMGGP